ncbi:hypothetical protein P153DRAFT_89185 [Dothidotthia symphoricarpi CBS 119687]|uniref:Uncharacterized protein n=1 Tax=Dothidotthia symphoricarpi CBS 119687 TaxID=1392245 RepID=A0A6A6A3Z2_9PLEO|nr:uncharacterized protein P153DRAFT_89185 [Dothidotthia symphoricarpi CBS 119687]KAF2126266.1 hypothetical protein P153DRAFT_89185 [Dothidotthia symphoricarpi CBS 119687]
MVACLFASTTQPSSPCRGPTTLSIPLSLPEAFDKHVGYDKSARWLVYSFLDLCLLVILIRAVYGTSLDTVRSGDRTPSARGAPEGRMG